MEIPTSLIKAVNKVIELNISIFDEVMLEIYARNNENQSESVLVWAAYHPVSHELEIWWDWLIDETRKNKLRVFSRNEMIKYEQLPGGDTYEIAEIRSADVDYILKFIIDYYLFFNPQVTSDDICTDIHFNTAINEVEQVDLTQTDYTFSFFQDSTDSGQQQLERCLTYLKHKRKIENEYK